MATGLPVELEQEYQRNKELRTYFKTPTNQPKVTAYLPLKFRQTEFELHLGEFEGLIPKKDVTTIGITAGKKDLKSETAKAYAPICLATFSYAGRYDKDDLRANMNFTETKIYEMVDGDILAFAQATNAKITADALPDPLYADYGITALVIAAALAKAQAFNDSMGKAGGVAADISAVVIALEKKNLKLHDDVDDFTVLMSKYKGTDADFYNGFLAAKVINDIGVNHSGIEGIVKGPDGNPLKDVFVICLQNDKKKDATDVLGQYEIKNFIPGAYEFRFSHAVHGEKIVVVKIEKGKVKTVDVVMGV